jgi:hypothetical protein
MKKITLFLTLMLALCASARLNAANFTSTNSGNWTFTGTWTITSGTDADGIPDGDDDVTIESSVTLTRTVFPKSLTFTTTSGSLKGRYAVIVGTLTMSGGILGNDGDVEVTSRLDCTGGRIGDLISTSQTFLLVSGHNSVTTWTSGNFSFLQDVSMEVMSTATLNVTNNNSCGIYSDFGGTCKVDINGKLNIINSQMFPLIPLSSTGTIKLTGSSTTTTSLTLNRGGTITGSIECGEFTSVSFNDFFSYTMTNTTLSGLGGLTVSASGILSMINVTSTIKTISVLGNLTVSSTTHSGDLASGGSLGIGTALTIGGRFEWFGGLIYGPNTGFATLTVNGFTPINGGGHRLKNINLQLQDGSWSSGDIDINDGKLSISGNFEIEGLNLRAFSSTNSQNSAFEISGNLSVGLFSFLNAPTIVTIEVPFQNTGDVDVYNGTLKLKGGGTSLGSFNIFENGTLAFCCATFNLGSCAFAGMGILSSIYLNGL